MSSSQDTEGKTEFHRYTHILRYSYSSEVYRLQVPRVWRGISSVEGKVWRLRGLELVSKAILASPTSCTLTSSLQGQLRLYNGR